MSTEQIGIWKSGFGDRYTDRNNFDSSIRQKSWDEMILSLGLESILEVGCNRGKNLECIKNSNPNAKVMGCEPNKYAFNLCKGLSGVEVFNCDAFSIPLSDSSADLVFTSNVLIHISLEDLPRAMKEIHRISSKYILCIEYVDNEETNIHYRGHDNALWKRDFQNHYETSFPDLKLVASGFWDWESGGFDNSNWYLWEKNV
tara:strand:+ start:1193 stop:1795 length:603 start_codon:yes stop_codon:yes gene_type:complete